MSSPLYARPCCNIKTCSRWQANVTVSVSRSVAMLRCQPLCSLQATAAWAPSVASTNLQQFRSGPRPTHRINAHNLNWVSVHARGREKCGLSLWDLAQPTRHIPSHNAALSTATLNPQWKTEEESWGSETEDECDNSTCNFDVPSKKKSEAAWLDEIDLLTESWWLLPLQCLAFYLADEQSTSVNLTWFNSSANYQGLYRVNLVCFG